jgi:hypothetical protein
MGSQGVDASCLGQFVDGVGAVEGLVTVVELIVSLICEVGHLVVMLPDDVGHKYLEVFKKFSIQWGIVAQLWKLSIDCPDHLDIVVFDELQVLLLVLLRESCQS